MVNPDNSVYISDILVSCGKISKFVLGLDYNSFTKDDKTISAVLRELSVIGEATRRTTTKYRQAHPEVPWEKILGMRNKLVHDYMGVQLSIVWETVTSDIPQLVQLLQNI